MPDVSYQELTGLVLALFVLVFMAIRHDEIRALPGSAWLFASFHALFLGYVFTIAEGFIDWRGINFIEHLGYTVSIVLLAVWARRHLRRPETRI